MEILNLIDPDKLTNALFATTVVTTFVSVPLYPVVRWIDSRRFTNMNLHPLGITSIPPVLTFIVGVFS